METILATTFGRKIDVQGGEADELTKTVNIFFGYSQEEQLASRQWRLQGGFWGFWKLVSLPIRPDMSLATLSEAGMITATRKAT